MYIDAADIWAPARSKRRAGAALRKELYVRILPRKKKKDKDALTDIADGHADLVKKHEGLSKTVAQLQVAANKTADRLTVVETRLGDSQTNMLKLAELAMTHGNGTPQTVTVTRSPTEYYPTMAQLTDEWDVVATNMPAMPAIRTNIRTGETWAFYVQTDYNGSSRGYWERIGEGHRA